MKLKLALTLLLSTVPALATAQPIHGSNIHMRSVGYHDRAPKMHLRSISHR